MTLEEEIKQTKFKSQYQKAIINILFTAGWIENEHHRFFKQYGISSHQYNILRILRGQNGNPASMGMLQERMLDRMSNASRLVEKLKQKGLVDRTENKKDRRQVDVTITKSGLDLLNETDDKVELIQNAIIHISEEESKTINLLLDKLRDKIKTK
ncbi:MAG: MarR family transcriptional regulator [Bacteroidetes bacterium]|nr:MarR family transcriptional regulator [Bacteroidota bacterium]